MCIEKRRPDSERNDILAKEKAIDVRVCMRRRRLSGWSKRRRPKPVVLFATLFFPRQRMEDGMNPQPRGFRAEARKAFRYFVRNVSLSAQNIFLCISYRFHHALNGIRGADSIHKIVWSFARYWYAGGGRISRILSGTLWLPPRARQAKDFPQPTSTRPVSRTLWRGRGYQ